jgi:hypothetical protein
VQPAQQAKYGSLARKGVEKTSPPEALKARAAGGIKAPSFLIFNLSFCFLHFNF